jgi:ubiquinone biosynthesis protein
VLNQLEDVTARGVALDQDSVAAIGRAEARGNRWGVAALWIIAASLMIMLFRGFA